MMTTNLIYLWERERGFWGYVCVFGRREREQEKTNFFRDEFEQMHIKQKITRFFFKHTLTHIHILFVWHKNTGWG